jgi:hypothetical protein
LSSGLILNQKCRIAGRVFRQVFGQALVTAGLCITYWNGTSALCTGESTLDVKRSIVLPVLEIPTPFPGSPAVVALASALIALRVVPSWVAFPVPSVPAALVQIAMLHPVGRGVAVA